MSKDIFNKNYFLHWTSNKELDSRKIKDTGNIKQL